VCGRFVRKKEAAEIAEAFGVQQIDCDLKPSYNIAPTQQVAVIVEDRVRKLVSVRWGLVPAWSQDLSGGSKLINARAETITEKAVFREAFQKRRCIVVADGFYEWEKIGAKRQPLYIRLKDDSSFGFAGLYEDWLSPERENIRTCTIITTEPNDVTRPIHDRMPAIIPRDQEDRWLDPDIDDPTVLLELLKPYPAQAMEAYRVSTLVNSPANDSLECLTPADSIIGPSPASPANPIHPMLPFTD